MPVGLAVVRTLNEMFADFDGNGRSTARGALDGASSVHDAIERAGLYDALDNELEAEGRAVFTAIPPDVDRRILSALRDAFERDVVITVEWQEHSDITVEVSELAETSGVHIVFHSPDGREFL